MDCDDLFDSLAEDTTEPDAPLPLHVRRHLLACLRCRRTHETLQRGRAVLASLPPLPVASDFREQVECRIRRFEEQRRRTRRRIRLGTRVVFASLAGGAITLAALSLLGDRVTDGPFARGAGDTPPSARVIRPFSQLAAREDGGVFERPLHERVEAAFDPGQVVALPRLSVLPGWHRSRGADEGSVQRVLYAAPSWTFSAAPASFRVVSAYPTAVFPSQAP